MLEYAGGDKLYIPVENIDVLSRYGSGEEGAALDRLGGEAGSGARRGSRSASARSPTSCCAPPPRARCARRRCSSPTRARFNQFVERFPWEETDDQERAIEDVLERPRRGQADGPAGVRRRRLRQDRGRAARRLRRGDERAAGRGGRADHAARAPALPGLLRALRRLPAQGRPPVAAGPGQGDARRPATGSPTARWTSSSAPTRSCRKTHQVQAPRPGHRRRGAALRRHPQGSAQAAARRRPRAHAHRHADPAHAADGDERAARAVDHPDPAGRPPRGAHLRDGMGRHGDARGAAARASPRRAELHRRAAHRRHGPRSRSGCTSTCPRSSSSPRTAR